ncbi:amidase family protein [Terrabacter sp. NPDC000476]|uniref:amidase family protein n=1 Tax=Terrabacter sp. NPDC000476 TaxID=3154258 RepID=UPI0033178F57
MNRRLVVTRSVVTGLWVARRAARTPRLRPLDTSPFDAALAGFSRDRRERVAGLVDGSTISRLGELMDDGRLTSTELVLLCLSRIREHDDVLRSVIELNPHALDEAAAADERRRAGGVASPLDGMPVTVKDNIETAPPMRTTVGSMLLADHVAQRDAEVVVRLRAAGAVILGTANLSELAGAMSTRPGFSAVGGQSVNPFGAQYSPGGSSSGSAVGVAAGLTVASLGTETSGSLLVPAAFTGVVAMKPSRGVVSGEGVVPLVRTQDSAGPVARSVADVAAVLAVVARRPVHVDLPADARTLEGARVGVLRADVLSHRTPFEDTTDNDAVLARLVAALAAAGADVVDVRLGDRDGALATFDRTFPDVVLGGLVHDTVPHLVSAAREADLPVEGAADLLAWNLRRPRTRMPSGQALLGLAVLRAGSATAYVEAAQRCTEEAASLLARTFDASGSDVLLSLSNRHANVYATAGFPAVTVSAGLRSGGMPVGATLVAPIGEDARLLEIAHALEQATGPRPVPPLPA